MSNQNSMLGREEIPSNTLIDSRYLIQQILGQGGLGRTYLAWDTRCFNEPCVLKEFAPFGSGNYDLEKSRNLFKREAEILHKINHPQIPKFIACFEAKGRLFLVQEYVKGQTYSALLEKLQQHRKAFTEAEIVEWLGNLLPILDYIHRLGIIHRDISPDNIMQPQGKGLPVLIDFGVGKLTDLSSQESYTKDSYVSKISFVGKMGYAPREQITMGRCSPSSDIYALGVTALVLLTGKEPTALVNRLSLEWQWEKYTQVSPKLTNLLSQMTEEKPLKRYQSAQEVLQDLQPNYTDFSQILSAPTKSSSEPNVRPVFDDETVIMRSFPSVSHPSQVDETLIVTGANTAPILPSDPSLGVRETSPPIDRTIIVNLEQVEPQESDKSSSCSDRSNQSLERSQNQSSHQSITKFIRPEFIRRCEQELAYCIGSIASFVVQEVVEKKRPQSPEELITALAEYLPDRKQMAEFKQRF